MKRRRFLPLLLTPAVGVWAEGTAKSLRGRLTQREGKPPVLTLPGGQIVALDGDAPTRGVLNDDRLKDADFEVRGDYSAPGQFQIEPIHTRSLFAWQKGERLMVTYWCDICYIRTFTPGVCWCCQENTRLDLKDPDTPDPKP